LPPLERRDLMAYEYQRQQQIEKTLQMALESEKPFAEVITAQMLIALLRFG